MSIRYPKIPPLRSLMAFEAAARHGKFASAADELGMTQAGMSQHVAQLEADLSTALFDRHHRGVSLTRAGETLLETAERALSDLSEAAAAIRRQGSHRTLHIRTDFGFAAWWLMPRLAHLSALMPEVEVRITTAQAEISATDRDFDMAIICGHGDWPGYRTQLLFPERIYPVCAPGYLAQHFPGRSLLTPEEVAGLRLLHLKSDGRTRWFSWPDWLAAHDLAGLSRRQDLSFSNYQLVLQAVLMGQGVAIGWTPLIDELVTAGLLVRLSEQALGSDRGYFLAEHPERKPTGDVATLRDWLTREASASGLAAETPYQGVQIK